MFRAALRTVAVDATRFQRVVGGDTSPMAGERGVNAR